jgi:hypothetical protein
MAPKKKGGGGPKAKGPTKSGGVSNRDYVAAVVLVVGIAVGFWLSLQTHSSRNLDFGEAQASRAMAWVPRIKTPPWPKSLQKSDKTASGCPTKFEGISSDDREVQSHLHKICLNWLSLTLCG